MSEIEILSQLKKGLLSFLDELIASFPSEPDFVIFRIFVNDKLPIVDIMDYIIYNLLPLQDMVKNRNEKFFMNYNILFEKFDETDTGKVNKFKTIWLSNRLDKDDKETIWKWFQSFIYLANKYNDLKRR